MSLVRVRVCACARACVHTSFGALCSRLRPVARISEPQTVRCRRRPHRRRRHRCCSTDHIYRRRCRRV